MSNPVTRLPELSILLERLKDPMWIKYYKKYNCYVGPSESIEYLINFFQSLTK